MIECVSAAIAKLGSVDVANYSHREMITRTALEAMRQPTEAMIDAAYEVGDWGPGDVSASVAWQAMIDAALNAEAIRSPSNTETPT